MTQKRLSGRQQSHAAGRSLEQRRAELVFERADLAAAAEAAKRAAARPPESRCPLRPPSRSSGAAPGSFSRENASAPSPQPTCGPRQIEKVLDACPCTRFMKRAMSVEIFGPGRPGQAAARGTGRGRDPGPIGERIRPGITTPRSTAGSAKTPQRRGGIAESARLQGIPRRGLHQPKPRGVPRHPECAANAWSTATSSTSTSPR